MGKAIFLDRDGTLIVDKNYLNDYRQIEYLDGVFPALRALCQAGYLLVMVTNQSGIAKGLITWEQLEEIHNKMQKDFAKHGVQFSEIFVAPYASDSQHPDRKPAPGMLLKAIAKYNIDVKKSYMIGDKQLDMDAGQRAGVTSLFIGNEPTSHPSHLKFNSWADLQDFINNQEK